MRKIIEYTLMSADGVVSGPQLARFMTYRDDADLRDGLGQLMACEAMLMGRTTYVHSPRCGPNASTRGRTGSTPSQVRLLIDTRSGRWANSTLIRGDVATYVAQLKQQEGGHLLVYGQGLLARTRWRSVCSMFSICRSTPLTAGSGQLLFDDGPHIALRSSRPRRSRTSSNSPMSP